MHGSPANETLALTPVFQGRILLLEDDESFKEIIEQFLIDNGYAVTTAKSGAEALNEVFAVDYTAIFCDMMLPTLRGDMFYRVVERMRPDLCERFVFMTGHQADGPIAEFIQRVNRLVLLKPFHLSDLLGAVITIETERLLAELQKPCPFDATGVPAHEPAPEAPSREALLPRQAEVATRKFIQIPIAEPVCAAPPAESVPPVVEHRRESARSIFGTFLWVAPVVVFVVIFVVRYLELRTRVEASSAELLVCEQQWTIVSGQLREAESRRHGIEAAVNRAEHIAREAAAARWTLALRDVATAAGADVELQGIHARGEQDAPAVFHIRATGVCNGPEPRATADRFRQTLEANLKQFFAREGVTTRFERFEEATRSPSEPLDRQKRQAAFTVIATAGSEGPKIAERKGGR